jgi:2-polyprenyl-3-methyl-5-hydroxy-6-metoxy-1,4-benzoquinol methylase
MSTLSQPMLSPTRELSASRFPTSPDKVLQILEGRAQRGADFPRIAVFIVSYNDSHRLVETIKRIPTELLDVIQEIFVFDDFSTDDTHQLAEDLARTEPWAGKLKVYRNPRRYGYGGNQKVGFTYAIEQGFDYVVLLHGDGKYAPESLPDLLAPVLHNGQQVVFGSRMFSKYKALEDGMPLVKWLGNIVLTGFLNTVLGMRLREFHSGYRLYSTAVLKRVPFEQNSDGFHFDTQIIIQCRALGVPIHEVPIPTYYGSEIRNVKGLRHAAAICYAALEYRLHQLHLVRRMRYVVDRDERYKFKESPYSSHGLIIRKITPGSVVLDVGCGRGFLARAFAKRGAHVVGVDGLPPSAIVPEVNEYHKADLEQHEKLPLTRRFDFIVLADVIEHLRNEEGILRHLRQFLKTDGRLIISTGNIAIWVYRLSLLLGRFNYGPRGILDQTHVRLYTRSTFRRALEKSGYKVTSIEYTTLPFEIVFESTGRSVLVRLLDSLYHQFTRVWPTLFAYQFVVEAEIRSLEAGRGEGVVFSR